MIVKLNFNLPCIGAITIYPWIFITRQMWDGVPDIELSQTIAHESSHLADQRAWFKYAGPLGLLAWFFCYELLLPVYWNPLRRATETKAYMIGQHLSLDYINSQILPNAPYWLARRS